MAAAPVGERFELPFEIAGVERSEPGRARTVALAAQAVAREAGAGSSGATAAERDHFARLGEVLARPGPERSAGGENESGGERRAAASERHRRTGTGTAALRFPLWAAIALCAAACKPPPEEHPSLPLADAARGKQAIERVGCAACHTIDGIRWPQGRSAPELRGFERRALIAGQLPNRPDVLAAFVRNAPQMAPGTTMPAMPLSEQESRDVAAYLYEIGD